MGSGTAGGIYSCEGEVMHFAETNQGRTYTVNGELYRTERSRAAGTQCHGRCNSDRQGGEDCVCHSCFHRSGY